MRLKLDENLGFQAAQILLGRSHDVSTVRDEGLSGASDARVLDACLRETRCLLTLDLGFGNPLTYVPSRYPGIVVLRLPARPSFEDLIEAIHVAASGMEREDVRGKLWMVQRGRIRVYEEPSST